MASKNKEHGSTNSRVTSTGAVNAVGADTVSVAFRTADPKLWDYLAEVAGGGEIVVSPPSWPLGDKPDPGELIKINERAFGALALARPVRCAQWRIYPAHRLIYFEGRLSAILTNNSEDHSLANPAHLPNTAGLASQDFERIAHLPEGSLQAAEQSVRRLDLAAELRFERRSDGLAFLRSLAALTLPRKKVQVWRQGSRAETVSFHRQGGGLLLRAYDKGAELKARGAADAEPPGLRIRIERQHRWARKQQKTPLQIATMDYAALWLEGFEAWSEHAERVTVMQPGEQAEAVMAAVEAGAMTVGEAERLLAAVAIARHRGTEWWSEQGKADTGRRRLAEASAAGIALDTAEDIKRPATASLAPAIRSLREAWSSAEP